MKRLSLILLLIIVATAAFAVDSFTLLPQDNIYKESIADPYAFRSYVHVLSIPNEEDRDMKICGVVSTSGDGEATTMLLPYENREYNKFENGLYINMKLAEAVSFFRFSFEHVTAEVEFAGYINTVFALYGSSATSAFDGSYFYGVAAEIYDDFDVRFGVHHFSGHYGDEILEKLNDYYEIDYKTGHFVYEGKDYYLSGLLEYVRDNSWIAGLSYDTPVKGLRVYTEAELPMKRAWIRPFFTAAADTVNPGYDSGEYAAAKGEGWDVEGKDKQTIAESLELKTKSYQAWRIHLGAEYSFDVDFGSVFASADMQFHQDGQNRNKEGLMGPLNYSKDNPWDTEITIGGGVCFDSGILGKFISVEALYHTGRFPSTQWFYKNCSYVTIGFGVN